MKKLINIFKSFAATLKVLCLIKQGLTGCEKNSRKCNFGWVDGRSDDTSVLYEILCKRFVWPSVYWQTLCLVALHHWQIITYLLYTDVSSVTTELLAVTQPHSQTPRYPAAQPDPQLPRGH